MSLLAYVTTYDSSDPSLWAGTGYHIARAMERAGFELLRVGSLVESGRGWNKVRQEIYRRVLGTALHRDREPMVLRGYARQVEAAIAGKEVAAILSPGVVPVAELRVDVPVIVWPDATYGGIVDFYRWEAPASARSRRLGNRMEKSALEICAAAVFSSDWAAESAVRLYGIDAGKVHVVPYGANLEPAPTAEEAGLAIADREMERVRLLFIGTGWLRKGGDVAVEVTRKLIERGVAAELAVVGSDVPDGLPTFVRRAGYLSKKTAEGSEAFGELMGTSHFFLHPARADASPVVLAEANAFGVPCATTRVGGIPTIVRDGINGKLFAPEDATAMAAWIEGMMRDAAAYRAMCEAARGEYERRLNWDTAGAAMKKIIDDAISPAGQR